MTVASMKSLEYKIPPTIFIGISQWHPIAYCDSPNSLAEGLPLLRLAQDGRYEPWGGRAGGSDAERAGAISMDSQLAMFHCR